MRPHVGGRALGKYPIPLGHCFSVALNPFDTEGPFRVYGIGPSVIVGLLRGASWSPPFGGLFLCCIRLSAVIVDISDPAVVFGAVPV